MKPLFAILGCSLISLVHVVSADIHFNLRTTSTDFWNHETNAVLPVGSIVQMIWSPDAIPGAAYTNGQPDGDYVLFQGALNNAGYWTGCAGDLDCAAQYDDADVGGTNILSGYVYLRVFDTNFTLGSWYENGHVTNASLYEVDGFPHKVYDADIDSMNEGLVADPLYESPANDGQVTVPLDTDGDGLPDAIDPDDDNDGISDVDEMVANTDSLNSNEFFYVTIATTPDPQVRAVSFMSSTGRYYRVETRTNLYSGAWVPTQTNRLGNNAEMTLFQTSTVDRAYYRVRVRLP